MEKADWEYQIGHAEGYLGALGYEVKYGRELETCADLEQRRVLINTRFSREVQFYLLLHELGHVLIEEDSARTFESEHPSGGRYASVSINASKAARVSVLGEEYEAWRIGRRWARLSTLFIDDVKYDQTMTKNLMSYITWAADPKQWHAEQG